MRGRGVEVSKTLFLHLHFLHLIKEPLLFHQLFIASALSHAAVINDGNSVSTFCEIMTTMSTTFRKIARVVFSSGLVAALMIFDVAMGSTHTGECLHTKKKTEPRSSR